MAVPPFRPSPADLLAHLLRQARTHFRDLLTRYITSLATSSGHLSPENVAFIENIIARAFLRSPTGYRVLTLCLDQAIIHDNARQHLRGKALTNFRQGDSNSGMMSSAEEFDYISEILDLLLRRELSEEMRLDLVRLQAHTILVRDHMRASGYLPSSAPSPYHATLPQGGGGGGGVTSRPLPSSAPSPYHATLPQGGGGGVTSTPLPGSAASHYSATLTQGHGGGGGFPHAHPNPAAFHTARAFMGLAVAAAAHVGPEATPAQAAGAVSGVLAVAGMQGFIRAGGTPDQFIELIASSHTRASASSPQSVVPAPPVVEQSARTTHGSRSSAGAVGAESRGVERLPQLAPLSPEQLRAFRGRVVSCFRAYMIELLENFFLRGDRSSKSAIDSIGTILRNDTHVGLVEAFVAAVRYITGVLETIGRSTTQERRLKITMLPDLEKALEPGRAAHMHPQAELQLMHRVFVYVRPSLALTGYEADTKTERGRLKSSIPAVQTELQLHISRYPKQEEESDIGVGGGDGGGGGGASVCLLSTGILDTPNFEEKLTAEAMVVVIVVAAAVASCLPLIRRRQEIQPPYRPQDKIDRAQCRNQTPRKEITTQQV